MSRSVTIRSLALAVLLLAGALAGCSVPAPPTEAPPDFELKWGGYGSANGQFHTVTGVAVDASGNVYVADSANDRVQKFSASGTFVATWGTQGSANGQLKFPTGIAVDGAGNVLVADTYNHRIQKFSPTGAFLAKWGSSGTAAGQFVHPRGVAVDASGAVYVTDSSVHRVQKFNASGGFLSQWGSYGTGPGQLNSPRGIAVDATGGVFVADFSNHRIQRFTDAGAFVGQWGVQGSADGEFVNPYGIAIDAQGDVYVADVHNHRMQKFTGLGSFLSSWGVQGSAQGQFHEPYGVAVDATRSVYVVDGANERVQKFSYPTPNTLDVLATLDGAPWSGPVNFTLTGPQTVTGSVAPFTSAPIAPGNYTISLVSGGPAVATFVGALPPTQTLAPGGNTGFTLAFESTTNIQVVATLDGAPWSGSVNYTLQGLLDLSSSSYTPPYPGGAAPQLFVNVTESAAIGTDPSTGMTGTVTYYALTYLSGGPAGATLGSVTPGSAANIFHGQTATFSLNFWSAGLTADGILVNATLDGAPWSGPLVVQLHGALSFFPSVLAPVYVSSAAPHVFTGLATGLIWTDPVTQVAGPGAFYGITYLSGGPANASLAGTTPTFPAQVFVIGQPKSFTLHFVSVRPPMPTTGNVTVNATLDGVPWSGALAYDLTGPQTISGAVVPGAHAGANAGNYTIALVSGGPANAVLAAIAPVATQSLAAGSAVGYTFQFRSIPPPAPATGTLVVEAAYAGAMGASTWTGPVNFTITGPYAIGGASVPQTNANVPIGNYTFTYQSGGPPGTALYSVTPSATQTLAANGTITFRLSFR